VESKTSTSTPSTQQYRETRLKDFKDRDQTRTPHVKVNKDVEPITREDYTRRMLASAGLDPVKAGHALRKAVDKIDEHLNADKIQFFSKDGVVIDERVTPDTAAQLKAATELRDTMVDLFGRKAQDNSGGDLQIAVVVNW
jgi:hypothetical protein